MMEIIGATRCLTQETWTTEITFAACSTPQKNSRRSSASTCRNCRKPLTRDKYCPKGYPFGQFVKMDDTDKYEQWNLIAMDEACPVFLGLSSGICLVEAPGTILGIHISCALVIMPLLSNSTVVPAL